MKKAKATVTKKQVVEIVKTIELLKSNDALKNERAVLRLRASGFSVGASSRIAQYINDAINPVTSNDTTSQQ